jgi:T4 RnlA family RNA ligase
MKYLLTYEDALLICEAYRNFNFYKTETMIDGYRVATFNYFMCEFDWFNTPLKEKPEIDAYDMRGTTFVFNKDGSLYKRYFMLPKFFNLNQVPSSQYGVIKDKKIKYVTEKEDGSLVAFMKLPNGKIFAKTQGGFDNDMAVNSMKLLGLDKILADFIIDVVDDGFTPLFEYVAFDNRIVLKYKGTSLRFIGLRNNDTGEYISMANLISQEWKIPVKYVNSINATLDELIERAKVEKDREGWVVEFDDGTMVKVKTNWYWNLHYIRTENVFREDYISSHILNDTIDEVISQLDKEDDADAFEFIDKVKNAVYKWSLDIDEKVFNLKNVYEIRYQSDWNKFATENNREAFFSLVKPILESLNTYNKRKIDYMKRQVHRLKEAQRIIEKWSKV